MKWPGAGIRGSGLGSRRAARRTERQAQSWRMGFQHPNLRPWPAQEGFPASCLCLSRGGPSQFSLNLLVDSPFRELRRHTDGVLDRIGARTAVADDAHAAHAQQGRSAVFRIIYALLEVTKRPAREQPADLGGERAR